MLPFLQPHMGPRRRIQNAAAKSCHIWGLPEKRNINKYIIKEKFHEVKFGAIFLKHHFGREQKHLFLNCALTNNIPNYSRLILKKCEMVTF